MLITHKRRYANALCEAIVYAMVGVRHAPSHNALSFHIQRIHAMLRPDVQKTTNTEGLTFREWVCAATRGRYPVELTSTEVTIYLAAWRAGEDPTEHAAGGAK